MSTTITKSEDQIVHNATNTNSKYRVEINREICIGAASCVAIAGNSFKLDAENKVLIVEGDWDSEEIIMAAAQSCPVFAIKIFDKETNKQIFPET